LPPYGPWLSRSPSTPLFPYTTLFRSQEGELGVVDSTNPCGEIPLEEWEACNLGHINLDYFAPKRKGESFRLEEAKEAAHLMARLDRKSTRLNSSHVKISYAVFCLKKK